MVYRKLLVSAAGWLLMHVPAMAQLSNTTTTFSGMMSSTCSFTIPPNMSFQYTEVNSLEASQGFELVANQPLIGIVIDQVSVLSEPSPLFSEILTNVAVIQVSGNTITMAEATKSSASLNESFAISPLIANNLIISASVTTSQMNNLRYELPPGRYSYRTRITRMQ